MFEMPDGLDHKRYHATVIYNGKDVDEARRLADALRSRGLRIWFAEDDLHLAKFISTEISNALDESRYVVMSIGPAGTESGYMRDFELGAVISRASLGKTELIPVYLGRRLSVSPKQSSHFAAWRDYGRRFSGGSGNSQGFRPTR